MMMFIQNRIYYLTEPGAKYQNWKGESEVMSGFQEFSITVDNDLETNCCDIIMS